MLQLPNGCSCSPLKVNPANWQSPKASIKKDWYIYFRFYDPSLTLDSKHKREKLVLIKGMNRFKTLEERQRETQYLLNSNQLRLRESGYNPITGKCHHSNALELAVHPGTPFLEALIKAERGIQASASTKRDLRSVLNFVSRAAIQLQYSELPLREISRKHIKTLLSQIEATYGDSAHRFNRMRTYLMILYNELIEMEATEINPLLFIKKKRSIVKLRKLLSPESRKVIDSYLKEHHYSFWIFTHIFFHSGARLTEMMAVTREHVDIEKQRFIVVVKKGKLYKEVYKPIKDVALPYWQEAVRPASSGDYIFSKGLVPGKVLISSSSITKRWNRCIKQKLGITEDFYSLKHLNLDETAALIGIDNAAAMASHTSTAVTVKHYAINEAERQLDKLRKVKNSLA